LLLECLVDEIDPHLVSLVAPNSLEAEHYRSLRLMVENMPGESGGVVIAVCSPAAGDGKSTTAINLAGALAQNRDARVLLVDCDVRRSPSMLTDYLALGRILKGPGLVDAIQDKRLAFSDVVRYLAPFNLAVLPTGQLPDAPYETLNSAQFGTLLTEARRHFDFVIVDTPPILPVADSRQIAPWVDGFFMVIAADRTPRAMVEEALNLIQPERLTGIIFNRSQRPLSGYYGYGYGYAYGGRPGDRDPRVWWSKLLTWIQDALKRLYALALRHPDSWWGRIVVKVAAAE
jgi:capsular exopolysaccharide synthesis family protein